MPFEDQPPQTTPQVVRRASAILAKRLPPGWTLRSAPVPDADDVADTKADAIFYVTAPDGRKASFAVIAKQQLEGRDIPVLATRLASFTSGRVADAGLVAARYLPPGVRERLGEERVSFVDATGNVRVVAASPGLFLADRGADTDPWRSPGRPRGTLKGEPAAKAVRALADIAGSWTMRELVDVAQMSTGAAYRVVDYLEREGLAERERDGRVRIPRWDQLLRRWGQDYGFLTNSAVTRWIAPRGLDALLQRVSLASSEHYALTGSIAAGEWAPYAPARSAMIYARDAAAVAREWGLREADAGANVLLAEPEYDVPFVRTLRNERGLILAAPTQVVVDLMTGPGRNPQEAEELLRWMEKHELSWRS